MPRDVVAVMVPVSNGSATSTPPHWSVDFWVSDADSTAQRAADQGGKVLVAPHHEQGFKRAIIADPQGSVFSISQLMIGG
ncbi:MAG: hypothetical protein JOY86_01485 [Candidatus Eremiobacteraeota bacterium]|nr:hypothetical protein [Candidatus Eremiobacteraeota bacterium]